VELKRLVEKAAEITDRHDEVKPGSLFFAVKGTRHDGHSFVPEAVKRGAFAVVAERPVPAKVPVLLVDDARRAYAEACHYFYGEPSLKLELYGVTGTNGKSTVTHMLESILNAAGVPTALTGTLYYRFNGRVLGRGQTTPGPKDWHRLLKEFLRLGAKAVVSEVSSHALEQHRVYPSRFKAVAFTNLTRDHLDYHGDMESYYRAKRRLFTEYEYELAIVNADDPYGRRLLKELKNRPVLSYGKEGEVKIEEVETGPGGTRVVLSFRGKRYAFELPLTGEFQAYNAAAAAGVALALGIDEEAVKEGLARVRVPGRMEVVLREPFLVVVDYAHTPDAVERVLRSLKKSVRGRVVAVFGAGGNRDREKRPLMGAAADRWSDLIVLTSDNPRDEDPLEIIKQIKEGIKKTPCLVEPDRRKAIRLALELAREGDAVAVLGKGHEDYQEVKGVKYPFNDAQVVKEELPAF